MALRWVGRLIVGLIGLALLFVLILKIILGPQFQKPIVQLARPRLPYFSHVVVIMMENHGDKILLNNPHAKYINQLMNTWGFDTNYFGVTHVSLPNYVALLSGSTGGTHSDSPIQRFHQMSLPQELNQANISWQAVMESIPSSDFNGNWYPDHLPKNTAPIVPPPDALYAKKHNPFALFPALKPSRATHTINLTQFRQELASGHIAQFTWITPNLCHDMHGQASGPGASCPTSNPTLLIENGDHFLQQLIPEIIHSPSWNSHSVIFLTWDETNDPANFLSPTDLREYLAPGPEAPVVPVADIAIGGGKVPLLVLYGRHPHRLQINLWADHYSVLKTIEDSWDLPYLGHAQDADVPVLTPFFPEKKTSSTR
ncbi:alkaline phosphatase family protein [Sulfobacillus thermosulfidooxidans]|uniref:alkaline phosphatase family protein n=1 Tax=Sulfobacillus thermosulfidooxidans TaxID=28034 RepID=UPI0006B5769F|nr:alkaline phosphatase family protein [Sulfobacillus thermosulfidooxidans]